MGGQLGVPLDLIDSPRLGKRYLLRREPGERTSFHEIGAAEFLFGPADESSAQRPCLGRAIPQPHRRGRKNP